MTPYNPSKTTEQIAPRLAAAFNQLSEGVIVTDEEGGIIFLNAAAMDMHGMASNGGQPKDLGTTFRLLREDGTPYPDHEFPLTRAAQHGETVRDATWRIARDDGFTLFAMGTARPVRDADGAQIGAVLTFRDDTEREQERQALKAAIALKDLWVREIHHRVKNNLQLVSSLLSIQGRKTIDPGASDALGDLSSRVSIIADIHRALYEAGETDTIDVVAYLEGLCTSQLSALADSLDIALHVETAGNCLMQIEKATSLALALNELVQNSLKLSFNSAPAPAIDVSVQVSGDRLVLTYRDNSDQFDGAATGDSFFEGFGEVLINGLEKQLSARLAIDETAGGPRVSITVPLTDTRPAQLPRPPKR